MTLDHFYPVIMDRPNTKFVFIPICCMFLIPVLILPWIWIENTGTSTSHLATTAHPRSTVRHQTETTSRPAERTLTPRDIHSVKLTSINQSTYDALPDKEKPLLIVTKIRVLNGSVEDYYDI